MTLVILVPLLVCIVGLLVFALSSNKLSTLGGYAFFAGLLVTLLRLSAETVRLP